MIRNPITDEGRRILNWLSKSNFWANQLDYFARAENGTGEWLLDSPEFKSWVEGDKRFLWCCGGRKIHFMREPLIVGSWCGKNNPQVGQYSFYFLKFRSSIVVEHLERKFKGVENVALACVYFNYKEATTTKDIIANLLKQLWEQAPSKETQALYNWHQRRQTHPNVKELSALLRTESCQVSTFYVVLDALDEFDQNARASILVELHQIPNMRVMITGRTHVESTVLSSLNDVSTLLIQASNGDIRTYLNARVEMAGYLGEALRADRNLRATVIDALVTRADGMYKILLRDLNLILVGSLWLRFNFNFWLSR
jgi:hypothetical protein